MSRDTKLTCHCSGSLKRDAEDLAAAHGLSVSELMRETLKRRIHEENKENVVRESKAEERIENLIAQGKDEIRQEVRQDLSEFKEVAQQVQEVTAKTGVYTIANWELIKGDVSDGKRQHALSTGSSRLRDDLLEGLDLDPEAVEVDENDSNGSSKPWEDS